MWGARTVFRYRCILLLEMGKKMRFRLQLNVNNLFADTFDVDLQDF